MLKPRGTVQYSVGLQRRCKFKEAGFWLLPLLSFITNVATTISSMQFSFIYVCYHYLSQACLSLLFKVGIELGPGIYNRKALPSHRSSASVLCSGLCSSVHTFPAVPRLLGPLLYKYSSTVAILLVLHCHTYHIWEEAGVVLTCSSVSELNKKIYF